MAITFRRDPATRDELIDGHAWFSQPEASFDNDELIAVAEYLARSVTEGTAEWLDCARELSAWADADAEALASAAQSAAAEDSAAATSTLLREAAVLATR